MKTTVNAENNSIVIEIPMAEFKELLNAHKRVEEISEMLLNESLKVARDVLTDENGYVKAVIAQGPFKGKKGYVHRQDFYDGHVMSYFIEESTGAEYLVANSEIKYITEDGVI